MSPLPSPDHLLSHHVSAAASEDCVARADRVLAKMRAGGRTLKDASGWRPAPAPWR